MPRVNFCWDCGRKLRGNHHKAMIIHGHERILHKSCAKNYSDNNIINLAEKKKSVEQAKDRKERSESIKRLVKQAKDYWGE